jgi:ribosomal protein S18 acetylase RimI-like enzyme
MSAAPPNVIVRPATAADSRVLGKYGSDLITLHHGWDAERFFAASPTTPDVYAAYLQKQIGNPDVVVLLVEDAGSIAGYAFACMEGYDYMALRGPAGVIHDLFIEEGRRRQGLGRQLLDATVSALAQRGATQIVLSTAYKNERARRLFASAGLRPTMVEMTLTVGKTDIVPLK